MRHMNTTRGQFRREGAHCQIRLLGQSGQQPRPGLASQHWMAMPADLSGSLTATRTLPLANPHHRRNRNPKPLRRCSNRLPCLQGHRHPRPDIHGQW
jgi:hypothetical protein